MNILLTGGAGFIGYHLAKKFADSKKSVQLYLIDNLNDYYDQCLKVSRLNHLGFKFDSVETIKYNDIYENKYGMKFSRIDLADKESIDSIFRDNKFDFVINLAAQAGVRYSVTNPRSYIMSNLVGFSNILEAVRHNPVKHLIYASSSSIYGLEDKIPFSEDMKTDSPVSLYAATKKSNELLAYSYSHLYKIPTTGLRFFTVYGPYGRPDMAYFSFTKKILNGLSIQLYNNGKMKRDFTYIDDVVEGIMDIQDNPPSGECLHEVYNIGNNSPVELMYFVQTLEKLLESKANIEYCPMQQGDVYSTYASVDKINKITGFNPKTSIEVGLGKFIEWYKEYYNIR